MMLLRGSAALLLAACALPLRVSGQEPAEAADSAMAPVPLVDVPYVPQSEALCGGAAVAMVLRYWGERDVHAEQFAALVVDSGEGILTTDLVEAVRARGWRAQPFRGTGVDVRAHLARGWPVIALIEDRPGRYHYVVIVAWANGRVLFHDPARAPMRVAEEAEFVRAWRVAEDWALLILPVSEPADPRAAQAPAAQATPGDVLTRDRVAEDPMADEMRARAGRAFRQQDYGAAAAGARELLERAPDDAYGWQLLASSLFILGGDDEALDAWNRIGRPRNDLTRIDGLRRTRHAVIADAVDIPPGALITRAALAHARRRVRMVPAVAAARVDYRPIEGGRAEVHAAIVERPVLPHSLPDLLVHGARAALERSVRIDVANPVGAGTLWRGNYVWQEARRTLELDVAVPHAFGVRGVWHVRAGERTLTHALNDVTLRETRRTATVSLADWASAQLLWQIGGSYDHWTDRGAYGGAHTALEARSRIDRAALRADLDGWLADGARAFGRARLRAAVRSARVRRGLEWDLTLGAQHTASHAPRDTWARAGSGPLADAPLRAHALLDSEGRIASRWFAPQLAHASGELRHWLVDTGLLRIGGAVFMDGVAVRGDPLQPGSRAAVDAGIGLRLDVPGVPGGIRIDAAHGLSDGASAISAAWVATWPGW